MEDQLNDILHMKQEIAKEYAELQKKSMLFQAKQKSAFGVSDGEQADVTTIAAMVERLINARLVPICERLSKVERAIMALEEKIFVT